MEDGLIIILFFFILAIACIFLVRCAKSKSDGKPINSVISHQSGSNYSEFERDNIDRDVDEMPDDCLIYDELFDED